MSDRGVAGWLKKQRSKRWLICMGVLGLSAILVACNTTSAASVMPTLSQLKAEATRYPTCRTLGIAPAHGNVPPGSPPTIVATSRRGVPLRELRFVEEVGPATCGSNQYVGTGTPPTLYVVLYPSLSTRAIDQLTSAEVSFLRSTGLFEKVVNSL